MSDEIVILDTETTGGKEPVAIEIAALSIEFPSLSILEIFHQRYNPGKPIQLGATAVHHILDEDVKDCPPISHFKLSNTVRYLIGHNIDYDWAVIGKPDVKRIDTLALARCLHSELDSHTQSAMLYFYERLMAREKLKNAHCALDDVKNCRTVLYYLIQELSFPKGRIYSAELTIEKFWELSEKARVPTIMPFGKHKGEAISSIPRDYKAWLLEQEKVDEYLRKALVGNAQSNSPNP